jgi:hypothetical protein
MGSKATNLSRKEIRHFFKDALVVVFSDFMGGMEVNNDKSPFPKGGQGGLNGEGGEKLVHKPPNYVLEKPEEDGSRSFQTYKVWQTL